MFGRKANETHVVSAQPAAVETSHWSTPPAMAPSAPIGPQHAGPASTTPVADYRQRGAGREDSCDHAYAVLPWRLVEMMPIRWQRDLVALLDELHRQHPTAPWPIYDVAPKAHMPLADVSTAQEAEVGVIREVDDTGDLVFRDRNTGQRIEHPDQVTVLVGVRDRITGRHGASHKREGL
ncbi:MAG: hypothetical protein J2P17_06350 [Mycobacterium sp.]|nr:hypothetical protein [Mycobacterium sp.]